MTGFSTTLLKVETSDGQHFILVDPFTFTAADGTVITVPAYSKSDGASTPRIGWSYLPPFGQYWLAAFLHDYLYRHTTLPKDRCDDLLLEAMLWLGVPRATADIIFEGVRVGGWKSFETDRGLAAKLFSA